MQNFREKENKNYFINAAGTLAAFCFTILNGRDVIMAKLQPYHKIDKLTGNQYAIRVRKRCSDYDYY